MPSDSRRVNRVAQTGVMASPLLPLPLPRSPNVYRLLPWCHYRAQPDWLVEEYEGQMPCLVDNGEAYTESSEIVDYIEYFYPEPPLSMKDNPDAMAKVSFRIDRVFYLVGGGGDGELGWRHRSSAWL